MSDNEQDASSTSAGPDPGMVLSEEELVIETELVETGRARITKRVEVETVTQTIELRREVLTIVRLDPTQTPPANANRAASDRETSSSSFDAEAFAAGSLQEAVLEIVLMQEEALITKQLVPRERVRLTKQIETESRTIDADSTPSASSSTTRNERKQSTE